jgi:hypothetical protein
MAKNAEKVMQFVEKELEKNPELPTAELFEKAKKVDTGVAGLSLRQFNARFPLQVKRRKSAAAPARRRKARAKPRAGARRGTEGKREAVRAALLKFAADLSGAEERKDLVRVLSQVDTYVDQVMKAAGR